MRQSGIPGERDKGMVRLYAWTMIVAAGLAVVAALLATRTDPQYSASAEILIAPTITPSGNYIQPSMPTEQRVATSTEVVRVAAAPLGITPIQAREHLSVTVPVDTQVLVMTYTDATPPAALAGARAIAESFLKNRNPANGKNAVASLVGPPVLPSNQVATNYPVVLGVAVLGGLLIGFAVAWTWDRVRGRIRTVADAERHTNLDAVAVLPRTFGEERITSRRAHLDSLAARVLGQVEGGARPSLLVTGLGSGCGSTAVASQTALTLARMGRVAILVTADSDVIANLTTGREPERSATRRSGAVWLDLPTSTTPGLHLVRVGEWDAGGLAVANLTNLLPELHDRMPEALVVIDGPPAWQSAGMALLADKIVLVAALGRSSRASASAGAQALDHCAEKLMGLVITPRGGRISEAVASARAWATLRARRVMVRVAPLAPVAPPVSQSPATTVWAPPRPLAKLNGSGPRPARRPSRNRNSGKAPLPRREPSRSAS